MSLRSINKFLCGVFGLLAVYLMADLLIIKQKDVINESFAMDAAAGEEASIKKADPLQTKDYTHYLKDISGKQLFGQSSGEQEEASLGSAIADDVATSLVLVGIVAGNNTQAIVESKKNEKTYYLNKGESLDGFTVEEILVNKVILSHDGKKTALSL